MISEDSCDTKDRINFKIDNSYFNIVIVKQLYINMY